MHLLAGCFERTPEVAHGGKRERYAKLVTPFMMLPFHDLGHPHRVSFGIKSLENDGVQIELVRQYQVQMTDFVGAWHVQSAATSPILLIAQWDSGKQVLVGTAHLMA
tara:strand:- start:188 stop:508 length:321 start_codon:yes stop_codon:yes gene_type:complete